MTMHQARPSPPTHASLLADLQGVGLRPSDMVMVHASFRALGVRDPEVIIQALLDAVGEGGVLLMPALSYLQHPPEIHDSRRTASCVGFLPDYFRTRPGTRRSLHPTHSVSGAGARAAEVLEPHRNDHTPCGRHSPFSAVLRGGKILMLGCGLRPITAMHAVEEHLSPPYLFGPPCDYTITDHDGHTFTRTYITHDFAGVTQRYDRIAGLLAPPALRDGPVGAATAHLIDGPALFAAGLDALRRDPLFFVETSADAEAASAREPL